MSKRICIKTMLLTSLTFLITVVTKPKDHNNGFTNAQKNSSSNSTVSLVQARYGPTTEQGRPTTEINSTEVLFLMVSSHLPTAGTTLMVVDLRKQTTSGKWVTLPLLQSNSGASLKNPRSAVSTLLTLNHSATQWVSMSFKETLLSMPLLLSLKLAMVQPLSKVRPTIEINSTEVLFLTVSSHPPSAGATATEVVPRNKTTSGIWVMLPLLQNNSGASLKNLRSAVSTLSTPNHLATQWVSTLFNREASIITNTIRRITKDI